ncbi:uncharacterized protein LOC109810112 [Cajanus cajan]|uniref:uncharacterized protein LOC109810112 n=1 Tax=Cajanus cajan TaxID=3821 RepID=UPI00098D91B2|nr:uncharacterized protein LOC109810112 [Cajanus cajan]
MQARIEASTRTVEEDVMLEVPRDFRPFSGAIEAEAIPRDHRIPQVEPFDGTQDPSQHLTDFRAQMLICGGGMEVRCKLFMGTLKKAALDWFSGLPDQSITDFDVFSRLFMAQFAANKKKPPITSDLFDLKQQREESLKDFMQRFNEVALRIASLDERMAVIAFQKGLRSGAFDITLERANCQTMSEGRAFALSHIKTEEGQISKRAAKSREEGNYRQADHGGRARGEWSRNNDEERFTPLNVPRRKILHDVNSASLFEFPAATDRQLGPFKTDWCEFHRAHGHSTENCFILGRQIERLIKEGRLKELVARKQEGGSSDRRHRRAQDDPRRDRRRERTPPRDASTKVSETHQQPIHGDFNTIAGGFAGGGATSTARKRYSRSVLTVSEFRRPSQPEILFSASDYEGVAPYEDDPGVILAIIIGYNVKRVLIDQGSSAGILLWEAFEGMKIPNDRLIPYAGTLVGFAGDQVIARGYADLETTFGQGAQMKTVVVRYLVVKYSLPNGTVGVLKVDQEVARKCYGDSLKAQRRLYTAQVEQEVHSVELDPRISHFDRRPAPVEDVKEVTVMEGKKVKIGTSLSPEDALKLIEVLKVNISAFAWHAKDMPGVDPDFMCHRLAIDPGAKPVIQKRRKFGEEK